jgi:protein-L-isoaspartate(D-aspartate) O-methyltransferase
MGFLTGRRYEQKRADMVDRQLRRRGISDARVLDAMGRVPRHEFVPSSQLHAAYADCALPIGHGATISQPYIVALMTQALELEEGLKVLEVGTGSGYQAAVLAACGARVFGIERIGPLYERAAHALESSGFGSVRLRLGDGSRGWPEEAPFARILVAAAAPAVPLPLRDQLADGGILVAPVGNDWMQNLVRHRKRGRRWEVEEMEGVRFVPLIEDEAKED